MAATTTAATSTSTFAAAITTWATTTTAFFNLALWSTHQEHDSSCSSQQNVEDNICVHAPKMPELPEPTKRPKMIKPPDVPELKGITPELLPEPKAGLPVLSEIIGKMPEPLSDPLPAPKATMSMPTAIIPEQLLEPLPKPLPTPDWLRRRWRKRPALVPLPEPAGNPTIHEPVLPVRCPSTPIDISSGSD